MLNTIYNFVNSKMGGETMSLLSNLFGGSSSSGKASARQYQYNLALQKQNQEWQEKMNAQRYQTQVEDLKKAGINPLYGLGSAPTYAGSAGSVGMEDDNGLATAKRNQMIQIADLMQNMSVRQAQKRKMEQETKTEEFNTDMQRLNTIEKAIQNEHLPKRILLELKSIQQNIAESLARTANLNAEKSEINARTENLKETKNLIKAQTKFSTAQAGEVRQNIRTGRTVEQWNKEKIINERYNNATDKAMEKMIDEIAKGNNNIGTREMYQILKYILGNLK